MKKTPKTEDLKCFTYVLRQERSQGRGKEERGAAY